MLSKYNMPLTLKCTLISGKTKCEKKICILELMKHGNFSIFFQYDFILTPQQDHAFQEIVS